MVHTAPNGPLTTLECPIPISQKMRPRLRRFSDWPKGTQYVLLGWDLHLSHVATELATATLSRVTESHDNDGHIGAWTLQL